MKSKIKHYIKEVVIFVVAMTVIANIVSLYKSSDLSEEALNISEVILVNNENYSVPNEKPILVHLWATWCPTCKLEAPNIQTISQNYEVLTIAVKSGTDEEIQEYMKERDLNFKVINDKDASYAREFNIGAYPTTFIYDKKKNLVFSEVGYTSTFGLWIRMWWAGL